MHETLKPWGLNSAGVFSYLFLYMLILSLDNIAFAGVGSNQPAGHLKSCKVLVTRTNSYKLSSGPADKAHGNVSWAAKLHWPGDGLDNLVYISCFNSCWLMAPAISQEPWQMSDLTPAFSPAKLKGCLREEEGEESISCKQ